MIGVRVALGAGMLMASLSSSSAAETPVERGSYLAAIAACTGCHTPRTQGAAAMSGGVRFGTGPRAVTSANITPDRETGIGTWTDPQIAAAIRLGVRPDGTRIGPPMPQQAYRGLSDGDVAAIIAYLRSLPPVHDVVPPPPHDVGPADPIGKRAEDAVASPGGGRTARGRYLFEAVTHCAECHRPGDTPNSGKTFRGPHGVVVAPILTPANVSQFSDAELARIITRGLRPDGSRLEGPMPVAAFAHLTPGDLAELIAYARSAP